MDSEAETEHEWSESESVLSEQELREARVHVAAQFSDTATMREELEAGENPNVRDYDGSTPLYLVCLFADKSRNEAATIECIRLLLAHGASPNTRNYGGAAPGPLNYVAGFRSSEAVAMLLAAGAKVDTVDNLGFTSLHHAAARGVSDSVQLLLDHGADVNSRTTRDAEIWPERSRPTDPIRVRRSASSTARTFCRSASCASSRRRSLAALMVVVGRAVVRRLRLN